MKNQALFSSKDKSKKLKCRLLQFLLGAVRSKTWTVPAHDSHEFRVTSLPFPYVVKKSQGAIIYNIMAG